MLRLFKKGAWLTLQYYEYCTYSGNFSAYVGRILNRGKKEKGKGKSSSRAHGELAHPSVVLVRTQSLAKNEDLELVVAAAAMSSGEQKHNQKEKRSRR